MLDNTLVKQPVNDEEISIKELIIKLREWWKYMLSKWLIISIAGIIGATIGLTYAFITKPVYIAGLSFALEDEKSSGTLGAAAGLASQFGVDLGTAGGGGAFSGDNLLELMKSRSMVENTLLSTVDIAGKNETLAELYISFNKFGKERKSEQKYKNVVFLPNADRSKFSLTQDSVLGVLYNNIIKNNLSVDKTDKKLSIINVIIKSENELFSKFFVEILAKTVSDFYVDTKTKKSALNVAILQHQTDSVREELNKAIGGVALSVDAVPNANPGRQVLRAPVQRRQVDVQANTAILTQLVANLEVSKVSLRKETPLIQVIDRPILPLDKKKVGKVKTAIVGAIIVVILTVLYIFVSRAFKLIMA